MSAHTPGPWAFASSLASHIPHPTYRVIVDVPWPSGMPEPEWQANRSLVGAAPDMLEALEAADEALSLIEDVGHGAHMDNVSVARGIVLKAIAKAKGGAA